MTKICLVIFVIFLVVLVASQSSGVRRRHDDVTGLHRTNSYSDWPGFLATFYPEKTVRKMMKRTFGVLKRAMRKRKFDKWKKKLRRNKYLRTLEDSIPRTAPLLGQRPKKDRERPNIILMMADDQDVELGSLQFMPKLNKFLKGGGAHMENGFVTTPMCCPSRSSMLTGLYPHNHHVLTNNDNCSSTYWVDRHEPRTFATYLHDSGYKTGYFGKYLNKYAGNHIPQGWDEWSGLVRNSRFYNYTLNVNGEKIKHGFDYEKDYFPDLITNSSLKFFKASKAERPDQPIMMVMSYPGPHGPEDSAPQYQDLFFNVTTHHTPAYDYAPNPDKQWILQVTDRMDPLQKKFTDMLMTKRLQTLQSIDDAIERVCKDLEKIGELDNTYIFYTSDHGYHLGQFGLVKGKAFPFEMDIKVPFFVRGPKISPETVRMEPVLNIDIAPTFLDIAGVTPPPHMDGKSILPTLFADEKMTEEEKKLRSEWRDSFLVERGKMTVERFQKIRSSLPPTASQDNNWDENEVSSSLLLEKPRVTKQERLAVECQKPRFQAPCHPYQRRKCIRKKNGDLKIVNCKNNGNVFVGQDDVDPICICEESRSERQLQKDFLKKHLMTAKQKRKMRHKFLNLKQDLMEDDQERPRRSVNQVSPAAQDQTEVLEAIAEEEIDQVDIIMEDISDEISNLEQSIVNSTIQKKPLEMDQDEEGSAVKLFPCQVSKLSRDVNCSSEIYDTPNTWRSSRNYINEQIRRLRSQLFELKEIRKHLKKKRPRDDKRMESRHPKSSGRCVCESKGRSSAQMKRQKMKRRAKQERLWLERLRKRLLRRERKQMKKIRRAKKQRRKKKQESCANVPDEKLNCFSHDKDHWKTKPLWTDGSFCACTNSNTNTYWCVRTINITHNYLYCEFVSGIITYYNLNVDPYQLRNIYQTLSDSELNFMHSQLLELKDYSGHNGKWRQEGNSSHFRSRSLSKRKLFKKDFRKLGLGSLDIGSRKKSRRNRHFWGAVLISVFL